jgi:hypothetical protein
LIDWISQHENADALLFDEIVDAVLVQRVVSIGYADDLTDDEVEKIGRDPFLIAYALFNPSERCIVTTEVSRPSAQRQNRKIPMYAVRSACNVAGRSFSTEILDFTRAGGSVAVSRLENSIELSRTAVSCCVSHR